MLRDALDDEKRHFMLTGPKGSGKTVLAAEVAKIRWQSKRTFFCLRFSLKNHLSLG